MIVACARRTTPIAEAIRMQVLHIGNGAEPEDLDPHVASSFNAFYVLNALFEGLTAWEEKTGQGVPAAAERWDTSPDGLTYTFHLRPDLRWSNGDALTAGDFVFSFQRMLHPQFAAQYAYMLWPIKGAEDFNTGRNPDFSAVGVKAPDDRTLRIVLERPTPYLPALAGHPTWMPVHRPTLEKFAAVSKRGTKWTRPGNLVGNGPFALNVWTPNSRVIVAKNPRYWDAGTTRLNKIIFYPIENAAVEEHSFRAGQILVTSDAPMAKVPAYRAQAPDQLRADLLLGTAYLSFNTKKPPLNDTRVRRALSLAIDREAISRAVTYDTRVPAGSITPPNCAGYTARASVRHDFEAARRLLADAGYPGGKGLPEMGVQVVNTMHFPKVVEAIQSMWQRELGVGITIEPYELKIWLQNQQTKAHMIALSDWVGDFVDPATFLELFVTNGGKNYTDWSNADYDRLIAEAARTTDAQARFEIFQKAEALLLAEMPIAPIEHSCLVYLIHPSVKGWEPSLLGQHRYKNVWLEN